MIDNDDLLYRVDQHYLGPAGRTLPFRLRYAAVGVGAVIFCTIFVVARAVVHVPLGFQSLVVMFGLTVVLTGRLTRFVNADRTVRSVIKAAGNDLVAPRPPKQGRTVIFPMPSVSRAASADLFPAQTEGESR